jgi:hypothetical protein
MRQNNVKPSDRPMARILTDQRRGAIGRREFLPEHLSVWFDHGEVWERDRRVVAITGNPYAAAFRSRQGYRVLLRVEALGLIVRLPGPDASWHYPGETMLVEVWRASAAPPGARLPEPDPAASAALSAARRRPALRLVRP